MSTFANIDSMLDIDRMLGMGGLGLGLGGRASRFPRLPEAEADSLLSQIGQTALGGLQYVGETLDKPGRAVRGTLSGLSGDDWGGSLLNLIPFSDAMGLTDPQTSVSGRDLLETWGAPENIPGLFNSPTDAAWDVGGFLSEVALDPLTYVGIGPLTQTGKTAKASGTLTRGLKPGIAAGERALASVGLPFTHGMEVGTGQLAQTIAGGLDTAGDFLRYGNPVGRRLGQWFDPEVGGAYTKQFQKFSKERITPAVHGSMAQARMETTPFLREASDAGIMGDTQAIDLMRDALENPYFDRGAALAEAAGLPPPAAAVAAATADAVPEGIAAAAAKAAPVPPPETFAQAITRLAGQAPKESFFGDDKIYLASLWDAYARDPSLPQLTEEAFKKNLLDAYRKGDITLSRADLPQLMNQDLVGRFEIEIDPRQFGGQRVHLLRVDPKELRRASAATPTPASAVPPPAAAAVPGKLFPETVQQIDDLARASIPEVGRGPTLSLDNTPDFKNLYVRSQDWNTFDGKTGQRVKVPNALVVAKIEADKQGVGTFRALHDELAKHGRPVVVEAVGNESFMAKLRHMGYEEIDGGYGTGLGHSYVYWPPAPNPQEVRWNKALDLAEQIRPLKPSVDEAQALGLNIGELTDEYANHWYRYSHQTDNPGIIGTIKEAFRGPSDPALLGRDPALKNIPGNTNQINKMVSDRSISSFTRTLGPRRALDEVADQLYGAPYKSLPAAEQKQIRRLSAKLQRMPEKYSDPTNPQRLFNADPITDLSVGKELHNRAVTTADQILSFLSEGGIAQTMPTNLARGQVFVDETGKRWVGLRDVLSKAGFGKRVKDPETMKYTGVGGPDKLADLLGVPVKKLTRMAIPEDIANDVTGYMETFSGPKHTTAVLHAYDQMTNLFRRTQTLPFPAFLSRNVTTGIYYNSAAHATDPRYNRFGRGLVQPHTDMVNLMAGKGIDLPDLGKAGAILDQATGQAIKNPIQLLDEMTAMGAIRRGVQGTETTQGFSGATRLVEPMPLGQRIKKAVKASKDPTVLGGEASTYAEDLIRGAHYIAKRRQGYTPQAAADSVLKWHFDYSSAGSTPFEKSVMKRAVPFYCVPETTEILTRDGWKTWEQVILDEEVLTYNVKDDVLEWQPCEEVAVFDHDQELEVLENTRHRIEFTKGHRWAVRRKGCTITHSYGTYTYPDRMEIIPEDQLNSLHSIIVTAKVRAEESILTPKQARLLGWIVTDGYVRKNRGRVPETVIYQHPKKFLKETQEVAGGRTYPPHPDNGTVATKVLREKVLELLPYLKKENLCSVVTRLSTEAAEAMYDAMYKADGTVSPKRTSDFFAKEDQRVLEAFRILATMLGKRASKVERGSYVSHNRYLQLTHCERSQVHYKGRVWCPRTKNGTWVMKQGDFITVTGNTFAKNNTPLVISELMQHPGGQLAQTIRAIQNGQPDPGEEGFVPGYLREQAAIPLGPEQNGNRSYLTGFGLPVEEPFNRFKLGPGGMGRTAESLLAMGNPYIKAPLEMLAGRQFYSGRDLDTLDPPLARTFTNLWETLGGGPWDPRTIPIPQVAEQVASNSPIARALTTTRQVLDPRKHETAGDLLGLAGNLLTGVRTTDVDTKRARYEAIDTLEKLLMQSPNVRQTSRPYVPKGQQRALTPEEAKLYQLYLSSQKRQ